MQLQQCAQLPCRALLRLAPRALRRRVLLAEAPHRVQQRGEHGVTPCPSDAPLPFGAARDVTRDISYLSERLWISRGRDGATVLQRCDARALAPPPTRPDLSSTCAETGWQSGSGLCRRQALF